MRIDRVQKVIIAALLLITMCMGIHAASRTANISGLWSSTTTWGGQSVPTSADDVTIQSGVTVTVDMAAECASLTIEASGTNGTLTISGSNTLIITGLLNMVRPTPGELCTVNINAGTLSCGSLTMNSTTGGRKDIINITTGAFNVSGAVTTGTTGCEITFTGAGSMNLAGSLSGTPTLTTVSGSTVNYTETESQTIFSGTYNGNMGISGDGYKTLNAATTINETLTLSGGSLENGSYLTMGDGSTISRSQGALAAQPTFAGTVNLVYTGGSAVTTTYEVPIASGGINNLTCNSGGVIQGGTPGAIVNILTDAFGNTANWTGDIGRNNNQFRRVRSTYAGGAGREIRYIYGSLSTTSYEASMYRMISTAGYSSVNIMWKQFIDNFDSDTYSYTIKLQCATSSGGPWTDMYTYTPSGAADVGPETQRISNWTTNVGGNFYIRFNISGYTYGLDYWYFDDLVVDGQDPTVPSTVTVNGAFNLGSGEYSIEDNTLVVAGTVSGSSDIVGGTSSNMEVSGAGANLTLPNISSGINNFTISRGNGVTLDNDLIVNGILDLQSSNPSAILGLLETGADTLTMAEPATTTGAGDVTGYVKRTSFTPNINYSFGNEFTDIFFASGGTLPSQIVANISIGTSPTWLPSAVQRIYDFVNRGGSGINATISTHYLDSELNGLDENNLVQWTYGTPGPPPGLFSWGKSGNSITDNWVAIANVGIENFPTTFGQLENSLAAPQPASFVWNGSTSTAWATTTNWTPNGTPISISNIVIPDAATTSNDPTIPASASVNSIRIESGGIINATASSAFTVNGANGAWTNEGGTFNPGTSNVSFTNAGATVAGTSDFYDLTIVTGASLTPGIDCYLRIGNGIIISGTGVLQGELLHNTIEYNGGNQTVINPNGATSGYHNLVLSGTGTKTMPGTDLVVAGELTMSGSTSATAVSNFTVAESITIGSSNTLDLSTYSHAIGGDLTNSGTLMSASASMTFDGSAKQTITNSAGLSVDDLSISNTSDTVMLGTSTNCSVAGDLTISAAAVFDLEANTLTAVSGSIPGSGTLTTQNTTSTPLPTGKTWGGTLVFYGAVAQTLVLGTYNDLTVNNTSGVTASDDVTINGLISLPLANASASKGALDMTTHTALFGPSSTTTGIGEVSGIMTRTTIVANTTYTFGHENTSVSFPNVGTLPSQLSVKLSLGTAPAWKSDALLRIYDLAQTGGNGTQAIVYSHYLDSELNGNTEDDVVDLVRFFSVPVTIEYGRSSIETSENWLVISNVNIGVFAPVFGFNEIAFAEAQLTALTWNGSTSTSWVTAQNWTPIGAPSDITDITIPDAATTTFDPDIPALAVCKSVTIESGGILNSSASGELTIDGDAASWSNAGTFNPGTSTIVFNGANTTLSGSHDFYNISIEAGAGLFLQSGSYLGVTGSLVNLGTLGATEDGSTTIEYKGTDQIIPSTERLTNTYSTMLLSGSGTKTLPSIAMVIEGDLTLSGTVTAVADTSFTVNGSMEIGSGTGFTTGEYRHTLLGDITNNGTLTAVGSIIFFSGAAAQSVAGSSASTFDSITINNTVGVSLDGDALTTVSGMLSINNGMKLSLPAGKYLTVSGTLTNSSDSTGLVLESDATGTASLIHSTAGVEATVQRYMDSNTWNIFSPSVTDQTRPGFVTNVLNNIPTKTGNYGMMYYDETGGGWQYYTVPTTGNMNHGTGYLVRHTTDDALNVFGPLNAATKDVTITRDGNGWNSIGNPFQSTIGVREDATSSENFLTYNAASFDPSYAALYLWDEPAVRVSGVDYYKVICNAAFTPSRPVLDMAYMQPGQGFIVKSVTGGATMSFTKGMQVHDNTTSFLKSKRASWPGIILSVSSGEKKASTSVTFNEDMTPGLDITYDVGLLGGDRSFNLYTRLVEDNGINFMLQCLPLNSFEEMIVPLGFESNDTATISFSAETIDLPSDLGVFIEDKKYETTIDLQEAGSYTVKYDPVQQGIGRFFLHLANESTGTNELNIQHFNTYYYNERIFVKGEVANSTKARLLDLSGRVLHIHTLVEGGINVLPASNLNSGVYILQFNSMGQIVNAKLFIE